MGYLRNAWYVAGWSKELLPGALLPRRLLDEPLVLFRDSSGTPHALQDRCPHRLVPLHKGKVLGDAIQCGYHGLQFDGRGICVHNPHGPIRALAGPQLPTHRTPQHAVDLDGRCAAGRRRAHSQLSLQDPERFYVGADYLHVRSNYVLEIDNIMDLSHTEFLHATTLGSSGISQGTYRAERDGDTVWSRRVTQGEVMSDDLSRSMGIEPGTPCDRWLHVRWNAPSNMALFAGAVPAGAPQDPARETPTSHCFTPETTSHHPLLVRDLLPEVHGRGRRAGGYAQHRLHPRALRGRGPADARGTAADGRRRRPAEPQALLLAGDAGAVHARRVLARLIEEEETHPA